MSNSNFLFLPIKKNHEIFSSELDSENPDQELSHCPKCLESFKFVDEVEVCDVCYQEACSSCRCNCN